MFAGFDKTDNVTAGMIALITEASIPFNQLFPRTAGRLCVCREGAEAATVRESCGSRQEYEESQECSCEEGEPAFLLWIPDENTPDIVYYQV